MKKIIILSSLLAFVVCGCARYNATSLANLSPEIMYHAPNEQGVVVAAKAFTRVDCKRFLDRDVLRKGYQPVQLYIENASDHGFYFSPSRLNVPVASPEEVADRVHTSTVGRVVGYGAAAVIACPLFVIPAVVDGIKSSQANESLDFDYSSKSARDLVILPHSHINMLIFVPRDYYQPNIQLTLIDECTAKPLTLTTYAW